MAHLAGDDADALHRSWQFGGALYLAAIIYLLRYVFRREVMTTDKLFGAAAAYLMIGIFWAYVFAVFDYLYPNAFAVYGSATPCRSATASTSASRC